MVIGNLNKKLNLILYEIGQSTRTPQRLKSLHVDSSSLPKHELVKLDLQILLHGGVAGDVQRVLGCVRGRGVPGSVGGAHVRLLVGREDAAGPPRLPVVDDGEQLTGDGPGPSRDGAPLGPGADGRPAHGVVVSEVWPGDTRPRGEDGLRVGFLLHLLNGGPILLLLLALDELVSLTLAGVELLSK